MKRYSNETQRYLDDARDVLNRVSNERGLKVKLFDTAIFDRVGMKRAIRKAYRLTSRLNFRVCGRRFKRSFENPICRNKTSFTN